MLGGSLARRLRCGATAAPDVLGVRETPAEIRTRRICFESFVSCRPVDERLPATRGAATKHSAKHRCPAPTRTRKAPPRPGGRVHAWRLRFPGEDFHQRERWRSTRAGPVAWETTGRSAPSTKVDLTALLFDDVSSSKRADPVSRQLILRASELLVVSSMLADGVASSIFRTSTTAEPLRTASLAR